MKKMNGKLVAQTLKDQVKEDVQKLKKQGIHPSLCVLLAGDNPAGEVYVKHKIKACGEAGIYSKLLKFSADVTQEELVKTLHSLNQDEQVHGILVQMPLPEHLDQQNIISHVSPKKDVDALTVESVGALWSSSAVVSPCTPQGIAAMLDYYGIPLEGRHAVVVGRSLIVGLPMVRLLLKKNATVTVCHSQTSILREHTKKADVVISACGKHHLLKAQDFKKGAVVVDVGIHRIVKNGRTVLEGDVCPEGLDGVLDYFSPVPGGVGPMTIACLLKNALQLARQSRA